MVAAARLRFGAGVPLGITPWITPPRLPLIRTCPLGHKARHVMSSLRDGTLSGSQPVVGADTAPAVGSIDPREWYPDGDAAKAISSRCQSQTISHKPSKSCKDELQRQQRQGQAASGKDMHSRSYSRRGGRRYSRWPSCKDMGQQLQGHAQQSCKEAARTCTADRTHAEAVAATLRGQAVRTWGSGQ